MTLRRAWSFTDKREYICTSCDRKKGTRSVYVKYGVGRLKQILPSPTLLPICSLAPPGDLEGPLVRALREATQEPREPLASHRHSPRRGPYWQEVYADGRKGNRLNERTGAEFTSVGTLHITGVLV